MDYDIDNMSLLLNFKDPKYASSHSESKKRKKKRKKRKK